MAKWQGRPDLADKFIYNSKDEKGIHLLLSFPRVSFISLRIILARTTAIFFPRRRCKRDELALVCDENAKRLHVSYGRQSGAVNKERKLGKGEGNKGEK